MNGVYGFRVKPRVNNMIGVLSDQDVVHDRIMIEGRPVKKAILLLFMPTCPHCQAPKRWMETVDVSPFGVYKLAIDVSRDDRLANRVPDLFGLDPETFTVPRAYVIQNGRPIKQLKEISQFDPNRDFAVIQKPQKKQPLRRRMSRRKSRKL